jgi:ATP-dependent Clp protease ATP-binding subunit ClpB
LTRSTARPLKRVIQRELQNPLALALLQGDFGAGDTVQVDLHGEELTFSRAQDLALAA